MFFVDQIADANHFDSNSFYDYAWSLRGEFGVYESGNGLVVPDSTVNELIARYKQWREGINIKRQQRLAALREALRN